MRILLSMTVLMLVVACGDSVTPPIKNAAANVPAPAVDVSTPDKALRSYWSTMDSVRAYRRQVYEESVPKLATVDAALNKVLAPPLMKVFAASKDGAPETFSRDIIEVKVESDSRAVVQAVVKNTTPIPAGADVTRQDEEARRHGEPYRYILEKGEGGWRVAEIWEWEKYMQQGWRKRYPDDGKAMVPTLTFGGM